VLTSYGYASDLFNRPQMASSVEIKLDNYKEAAEVSTLLNKNLGSGFKISNRFEQHQLLYKIIKSEKWAVYLILTFILVIAVFNITGSLTMLIVDKSKDINTLRNMGANTRHLLAIFFTEGIMICILGVILGIITGVGIVIAQDQLGLVYISDIDPYPVLLKVSDIGLTMLTVLSIGTLASWLPANRLIKQKKQL
jgi:lipoprotein-releasing system permease protein